MYLLMIRCLGDPDLSFSEAELQMAEHYTPFKFV